MHPRRRDGYDPIEMWVTRIAYVKYVAKGAQSAFFPTRYSEPVRARVKRKRSDNVKNATAL